MLLKSNTIQADPTMDEKGPSDSNFAMQIDMLKYCLSTLREHRLVIVSERGKLKRLIIIFDLVILLLGIYPASGQGFTAFPTFTHHFNNACSPLLKTLETSTGLHSFKLAYDLLP